MKTFCRRLFATLGFGALLFAASFNFTAGAQPPMRLDAQGVSGQRLSGQGSCVLVAAQPPAFMVTLLCR
jgi:hypothetical protein